MFNNPSIRTIGIDVHMESGHILWLAYGRKKACVYSFIEHVGLQWMAGVEAVACDMNSDFQQAFQEKCPHIKVVFDFFHLKRNLNDKVVSEVRKDEQRRLLDEGDKEGAKALKGSRYILFSSRKSLEQKDEQARLAKAEPKEKAGGIFEKPKTELRDDHLERYERLLEENKLFFTLDLIKELLTQAYEATDEKVMKKAIDEIIELCEATENKHFLWFKRLLENHMFGIITHATHNISSGKIEGLNHVIKNVRRQGYGYPDDEYFFLKLFDASRRSYERNPSALKIPQDL
jgi:transposase